MLVTSAAPGFLLVLVKTQIYFLIHLMFKKGGEKVQWVNTPGVEASFSEQLLHWSPRVQPKIWHTCYCFFFLHYCKITGKQDAGQQLSDVAAVVRRCVSRSVRAAAGEEGEEGEGEEECVLAAEPHSKEA